MIKYFIIVIFSLFLAFSVSAQTAPTGTIKNKIIDVRQNVKQKIIDARQNITQEIKQKKVETVEQIKQKRVELKNVVEQKRAEFKNQIEVKRAELKVNIETKRQELKERLKVVKDERKKQAVERIDNRLDVLNEKTTNHFSEALERLEKVLGNISSRVDKAAISGIDISAVETAIADAQSSISASRLAIEAQAGKTYQITITNEAGLRQDVGKTRQALHADLVKTRETVFSAREAVKKAAMALFQIPRVDEINDDNNQPATSTAETNATSTEQ